MEFAEAKTLKDFLYLYNKISEDCFRKCIYNMSQRTLDDYEATCISTCVQKHVNVNHKTMEFFAEINPVFQQRKQEEFQQEMLKLQKQQEAANPNSSASSTSNPPLTSNPIASSSSVASASAK